MTTVVKKLWHNDSPIGADKIVGMGLQIQGVQVLVHIGLNLMLRDSPYSCIHDHYFPTSHVFQQSIKLRTIANF